MKILYISSFDISLTSGPAVNEFEFILNLHSLVGNNAHFIIPKPLYGLPADIPSQICTFTFPHKDRQLWDWICHQASMVRQTSKLLSKTQFDIIVIRSDIFSIGLWYLTRKSKTPYALKTAGSGLFDVFKRKNIIVKALAPFNLAIFKSLVHGAIIVDVVSLAQQSSLRSITGAGEKIVWIDNGVNIDRFYPQSTSEARRKIGLDSAFTKIIGYAGNFSSERGGMQIVESLPDLAKKCHGIGALILGSGSGMARLNEKAKELGVYERCVFTGQVNYDNVPLHINAMDIAVSIRYDYEQSASEVRQYLACGKPVIVSPGSNGFVKEEGLGFIVEPYDKKRFVESACQLLEMSEDAYNAISMRACNYARQNLTYKSKIEKRLSLWSELAG